MTTPAVESPATAAGIAAVAKTANAAQAKAATAGNFLQQPAFDTRMRSISDPLNSGGSPVAFSRGFMVWDVSYASSFGAGYNGSNALPYVNFLFNPSTVQASYQLSNTAAQAADMYGISSSGASVAYVSLQQTMEFTIMFDRTYELWDNSQYYGTDVGTMGCEVDVRQMKQFTGMFAAASAYGSTTAPTYDPSTGAGDNVFAVPTGTTQTLQPANGVGAGPQQGLMVMVPSFVYFGSELTGGTSQYYGYIDAWDVQYTHYTNYMVPIRCVVDVSYTLLPLSSGAGTEYNAVINIARAQNLA